MSLYCGPIKIIKIKSSRIISTIIIGIIRPSIVAEPYEEMNNIIDNEDY